MKDLVMKILGIDQKIAEAHHIKNIATRNLGKIEMERRSIKQAIEIIKRSVDEQEQIINDTASNIGVSLILAEQDGRKKTK